MSYEKMNSAGRWVAIPEEKEAFYLDRIQAKDCDALTAGQAVIYILRDGYFGLVNPSFDWYQKIRITPGVSKPTEIAAPRFTCPRCGEHRDTTRRGHCDDCES